MQNHNHICIRVADPQDAVKLLEIYAPYVSQTAITFEYEIPTPAEFRQRIEKTLEKYPYLVAERNDIILGYAYASPFKERAAYDWSVELSIYVRQEHRGTGIGRKLYEVMEQTLRAQNILNLNACIAWPEQEDEYLTRDSVDFHAHLGYGMVGRFHQCGYKFHRWYDMVWMEKHIGSHTGEPTAVIPFSKLNQ
jgi:phosphinothricin acetyltransferase